MNKLFENKTKDEILKGLQIKFKSDFDVNLSKVTFQYIEETGKILLFSYVDAKPFYNSELSQKESFMIKNLLLRKLKKEVKKQVESFKRFDEVFFEIDFENSEIDVTIFYLDEKGDILTTKF